jgi:hypothetical protein
MLPRGSNVTPKCDHLLQVFDIRVEENKTSVNPRNKLESASCLSISEFLSVLNYATGASMRQEVYRVAMDEASAELSEILARFEQMRVRKDRLEKVVDALKPLVSVSEAPAAPPERASVSAERTAIAAEPPAAPPVPAPIPYPVAQAAEETNDPFSRRGEGTLGLSSAAKDVREYSRLFNTGTSRGN